MLKGGNSMKARNPAGCVPDTHAAPGESGPSQDERPQEKPDASRQVGHSRPEEVSTLSRRRFVKRSVLAGSAWIAPYFIPAKALGRDGTVAPSERIVVAGVGHGPRGRYDLSAMLDEWENRGFALLQVIDGKKHWQDLCVVNSGQGPSYPCEWIEYDAEQNIVWLKGCAPGVAVGPLGRNVAGES